MNNVYLEDAKKAFLDINVESNDKIAEFFHLIGYIIPDKVTPLEFMTLLNFLIRDIRNKTCGFQNSSDYKRAFEHFINGFEEEVINIDYFVSYTAEFIEALASEEFYNGFIVLFKNAIYKLNPVPKESQIYDCIEISPNVINISNKNKADVLAALYNNAKPIGWGLIHYDPMPMTSEIAQEILDGMDDECWFSYLKGRPIKLSLKDNIITVAVYNNRNGEKNLAQKAIASCPNIIPNKNTERKNLGLKK